TAKRAPMQRMGFWTKVRQLAGGVASRATPAPPTPRELFTAEMEALVRAMPWVTSVRQELGDFALVVVHDGKERTAFLQNICLSFTSNG
ncbi:MAG TPA: hypothetical protein VF341_02830, partial [Anaeromyxobacteraceae bacterium]